MHEVRVCIDGVRFAAVACAAKLKSGIGSDRALQPTAVYYSPTHRASAAAASAAALASRPSTMTFLLAGRSLPARQSSLSPRTAGGAVSATSMDFNNL